MSEKTTVIVTNSTARKAVIRASEDDARKHASGQYKAYRVTNAQGQTVYVTAINPVFARGVAAEQWGVVAELLDRKVRLTKPTLIAALAQLPKAEREAILKELSRAK